MKIIDLLNRIANGEVPKKIKVNNKFTYIHDGIDYKSDDGTYLFDSYIETTTEDMNIEIEIIDDTPKEKKIPEKLKILNANEYSKEAYYENYSKEEISLDIETLQNWVNDIIDYLDYIKSKGDE